MPNYTVWNGAIPAGTTSTVTGARTDGLTITINTLTGAPEITAVACYVPATETNLAGSAYTGAVYTTVNGLIGTLVTSNPGSGTFQAGAWNWIPLASPVTCALGIVYVPAIEHPDLLQFVHNYWGAGDPGAGGLVIGPITVPDATAAPGNNQQGNVGGAGFPGSSIGSWYGVDVQVTTTGGGPPPAQGLWRGAIV